MTAICASCGERKPLTEFAFRNKLKGTRQSQCNSCRRQTAKQYYERNKRSHIDRAKRNSAAMRQRFQTWKSTLQCAVCGESDPVCLDFHHVDGDQKDAVISEMISRKGRTAVLEELSKCVCVCSNCHRKIHAGRIQAPLVKLDITQLYES